MNLFQFIARAAETARLPFLVIGAHAVNWYGYTRATIDVDILVRKEDRGGWLALTAAEGFQLFHDGEHFLQLSPPYGISWPLDLMLVNDRTFRGLTTDSRDATMCGAKVRVPSPEMLIALKLHVIKHGPPHRKGKDLQDILGITEHTQLDLRSEKYRQIFEKHGTLELYEEVIRACES